MENRSDINISKSNRGFWALIVTQFQNAFNDNAYKNMLLLVALAATTDLTKQNQLNTLITDVFLVPFLFFSMLGGYFADKYSKRKVILSTKIAEIVVMLIAAFAFYLGHLWFSVSILFLSSTQAACFGPAKYGIVPELVPEKRLSWANGILELTTFAAIILGTFAGALLKGYFNNQLYYAMFILAGLSVIGVLTSLGITRVPAAAPDKPFHLNFLGDLFLNIRLARKDKVLWLAVIGNTFFWFMGMLLFMNVVIFGANHLHLKEQQIGLLQVSLALGIGIGSYAAGRLSGNKIEYGLIPLGAIIMSLVSLDLFLFANTLRHTVIALSLLGFGGGFFAVPINALIQHRPAPADKGGIQGMSYFLTNVGSLLGTGVYLTLTVFLHLFPHQMFLACSLITLGATTYVCYLVPDSLIRLLLWLLTHTFYRIKIVGRDNIPDKGGGMFVSNHMSFVDALLVIASTDRFVRFIMDTSLYNQTFLHPIAKIMGVIPVSSKDGPRAMIHSLREATNAIKEGDIVCIFAEGQITRTGQMLPFRRGFERIMKGVDAPIIPIHLDRLWGSIFSFEKGKFVWKWPHRIPYPVTVSYGSPLPGNTPVQDTRKAVQELASAAFTLRRKDMSPLHHAFIYMARKYPRRFVMADGLNPNITNSQAFIRSIVLAQKLKSVCKGQEMVGLFMPPSTSGACLNIAALLCGKVPVNLNYTISQDSLNSSISQCKMTTVITAHAFMEKIKLTLPVQTIYLEDLVPQISALDKIRALVKSKLYPIRWLEKSLGCPKKWTLDDMATIIFSSGSTGDPKGVMLSHYNIYSNLEGVAQALQVDKHDRILGVLPFFHSFGFTGTLWFPLVKGFGVVFHPNPLDSRVIGALSEKYKVTLLVATPTFLQAYIRRVDPGQFGSLRFVIVGAEKLSDRIGIAFEDKFGIRPYEAYGCTECSPAVTINTVSYRAPGFYQVGGKRGRIGHPLPGISVRIIDPDTNQPVPMGQPGLLLVKGPNVMMAYLNKPEKTKEVIIDGWYNTGDIATLDPDGFIMITDRLSRFSKIGGEMVPHVKIEDVLHELAGVTLQTFAVTAISDERKGEKLIVLHTLPEDKLKEVIDKLPTSGLPNLWLPRPDAFKKIDSIPILGTGKLDLRQIKLLALSL